MKKVLFKSLYLIGAVLITVLFSSCGKEGENGEAYIAIFNSQNSNSVTTGYWDNNPGVSYGSSWGTYYFTEPGTYNYDYDVSWQNPNSGVWWDRNYTGTYTIGINKGEDGGLFKDGADGTDRRYKFYCNYNGASFGYKSGTIDNIISLPDTIIYYDGYYVIITRNIMPDNYISPNKPKLINKIL